nr:PAC2 family protein [Halorubrum salsamenti]
MRVPSDQPSGKTLLVGTSHLGMAGVTAADYLVRHVDSEQIGHISAHNFPAITPFQNGEPRHPTRLYNLEGTDLSVLLGELFVPVWAAHSFTNALMEWVSSADVTELAVLHGVPFPHGPEEHTVFHVATPQYRERRLAETDIQPLEGGFLDGVVGEILAQALDRDTPSVGVYITPTHPPGPDIDASLLLLDTIQEIYEFTVDEEELRARSEELKQYYQELTQRMESLGGGEQSLASRDYPEDRMFM